MHEFLAAVPIVDVHEHHMPEVFLNRRVGLLDLLRQSYAGWTQARPYPLAGETRRGDPMLEPSAGCVWEDIAPFIERSGANAFVRSLAGALDELYGLGGEGLHAGNWRALDAEIRRRHADPAWTGLVLDRAGVERCITDSYVDPLFDAREALGRRWRSVLRINALAVACHPERRDHNGNSAHDLARRLGRELRSFEDHLALLERAVATLPERGQVALKNALAYDRGVDFDAPDESTARRAFGERDPSAAAAKAFGDFAVDRLCALAGERDVPVQMHLGTALVRGSHPLLAAGLVERHPRTRFLLMHLAYPWSRELLAMAFVYRNVWLDLTWSFLLSPSHFKLALHEAIEVLPDETRLMLGGDNWHAEETYGALRRARRLVGEVLEEKVRSGYFGRRDAERLGRRILRENALEFFALEDGAGPTA